MEEAVRGFVTAIECGRTDIVRSAVSALERNEEAQEDIKLEQVLNSLLTPSGTLLHLASQCGQADVVRALLASGADPGIHNNDEKTPLDLANTERVRNVFKEELLQAVARSNIGRVCQLIASGVSVNMEDSPLSKNTPLHWAASYGNKDMIQCLTKRGAAVNHASVNGTTPLHDAVIRGNPDVVEELLLAGADPSLLATSGKHGDKTPADLVGDRTEIVELLEKYKEYKPMNGIMDQHIDVAADKQSTTPIIKDHVPQSPGTPNGHLSSIPGLSFTVKANRVSEDEVSQTSTVATANSGGVEENNNKPSDPRLALLWPQPRKVVLREGAPFKPEGSLPVLVHDSLNQGLSHDMVEMWKSHEHYLAKLNLLLHTETYCRQGPRDQPYVLCEVNHRLFSRAESYRLNASSKLVRLQASDIGGLHHGITTLIQLLRSSREDGIPALQLHDYPSLHQRGVLLDLSKGRIPHVESLRNFIKLLAFLKINQVQLYTRFYAPQEQLIQWQFPYTRSTLLELDHFCQSLSVTLTPVLDVLPKVTIEDLPDIYSSFQQFLSCFTRTRTVGLGPRLSSFLTDISEDGSLNFDDARQALPVSSDHTLQICAFVLHETPEVLSQFPGNAMLAEYGFQANYEFEKHSKLYEDSGVPFCVVPGTAAWNSLAGCPEAAVSNIQTAVSAAVAHGALGMLISHWSGVGHMTPQPISLTGMLTAAGLAWNADVTSDFLQGSLAELVNVHALEDTAGITGQVILELGRAETYVLRCARNQAGTDNSKLPAEKGSTLYQLMSHPDEVSLDHLTTEIFQKTMRHIRKCQSELTKARLSCVDGAAILAEIQLTADLMLTACRIGRALVNCGKNPLSASHKMGYSVINPGVANLTPTARTDLANRLLCQVETYRTTWLSRNLPQGLPDSVRVFQALLRQFVPESPLNPEL